MVSLIGLRIYGAAPSVLERVVPSTSSVVDESFDMMGYALPPGTVVGTQAWSMHRDAEVFPSAETFLPERWLPVEGVAGEEERLARSDSVLYCRVAGSLISFPYRMSQYLMPFGVGTRVCGGQNLAHMVLRVAIASIAINFDLTADLTETNEQTMEIKDAFVRASSPSLHCISD